MRDREVSGALSFRLPDTLTTLVECIKLVGLSCLCDTFAGSDVTDDVLQRFVMSMKKSLAFVRSEFFFENTRHFPYYLWKNSSATEKLSKGC